MGDKETIFSLDNNVVLKLAYTRSFSKSSQEYYKFAPSEKHSHQEQMAWAYRQQLATVRAVFHRRQNELRASTLKSGTYY